MSFKTTTITLASAVADDGTVTVPYPTGTAQADFTGANAAADGVAIVNDNAVYRETDTDGISLSYGASNITLTNESTVSWPAGSKVIVQLGQAGTDRPGFEAAPAVADASDVSASYAQAEVQEIVDQLNKTLRALRSQGIIKSA